MSGGTRRRLARERPAQGDAPADLLALSKEQWAELTDEQMHGIGLRLTKMGKAEESAYTKEWVRRSRAAQGLPPTITSPAALARTAELLLAPHVPDPTRPAAEERST